MWNDIPAFIGEVCHFIGHLQWCNQYFSLANTNRTETAKIPMTFSIHSIVGSRSWNVSAFFRRDVNSQPMPQPESIHIPGPTAQAAINSWIHRVIDHPLHYVSEICVAGMSNSGC